MKNSLSQVFLDAMPDKDHSQAEAEALFFSIGEGAIASDMEGNIRRINQQAMDILGFTEKEVIGQWFPKIIVAEHEDGTRVRLIDRHVSKALLTGKPISEKSYYVTKSGSTVPVFVTVAPILLEGRPVGAIEVFRDITMEQEIDKMKSEFISIASHQLRTPLTAIKTYAHLLANGYRGELSSDQQEFMDVIMTSIDRMNDLINTLLDISRFEEGKIGMTLQKVPVDDLVEELITELQSLADARKVTLEFNSVGKTFMLDTDPLLLKEVFANLISNAVKYTPAGGDVVIELKDKPYEIVFSVKDTGYGIPVLQQKRVFSKFFRADNVVGRDTTGTGLGLYLVGRIIETLGGKVSFRSKENKGSTFTVTILK